MMGVIAMVSVSADSGADTVVVQPEAFSLTVGAGFESEYTRRGESVADNVFTANINAAIYDFYVNVDAFYQAESTPAFESEVDVAVGYNVRNLIVDFIDFDIGVKAYTYPHSQTALNETDVTFEPYVGVVFDELLLNPAGYVYYDINRESVTLEGSISESFTSQKELPLLGQVTVKPSFFVGYTDINDVTPKGANTSDAYTYVGGALDVSVDVYGFDVAAGPRFVSADGDRQFDVNELSYGVRVSRSF